MAKLCVLFTLALYGKDRHITSIVMLLVMVVNNINAGLARSTVQP